MKNFMKTAFMVFLVLSLIPTSAEATTISVGFQRITNNNVEDLAGQLDLDIHDKDMAESLFPAFFGTGLIELTANQVLFAFSNAVGTASNISEIYIDDGSILMLDILINNLGGVTDFKVAPFVSPPLNPPNLPSGTNVIPQFVANELYSADTTPGNPSKGINEAADILGIVYDTNGGISAVEIALLGDGSLRIGYHVRSIGAAGGSDSYLSTGTPVNVIPEPSTMLLLGSGLAGLGLIRRRRKAA